MEECGGSLGVEADIEYLLSIIKCTGFKYAYDIILKREHKNYPQLPTKTYTIPSHSSKPQQLAY